MSNKEGHTSEMSINQLIREGQSEQLKAQLKKLTGFEIADLIEDKNEQDQLFVFSLLSPKLAAETFDYLPFRIQKKILHALPSSQIASMLLAMHPDDRTALLEELPRATVDEYVKLLPEQERSVTLKLLGYSEEMVGHYMTTDYIAIKMDWTIEKILDQIRAYGRDNETIDVIYVVDEMGKLIDDIRIRELFFVPRDSTIAQIADGKFVALHVSDTPEQAINLFTEYDRVALPVVDEKGILQGVVTIDDILRMASEETTEDMQKVAGLEALEEPYMQTPFLELMKKRSRWLVVLFIGEMFTATAMGYFEAEIAQAVVLALFLPLIISSGGNAGSQSSTLIIRAMALGEVKLQDSWQIMRRELCSGLFLGAVLGFIGFVRVGAWGMATNVYGEHWLLVAVTIALALVGVVMWGSFTGSMLPLLLKRLGADPATSSGPLVATLVDVTGITIYFGIAIWILSGSLL